ncbi:MAG: magnesium transporter [Proteobacteria bacterium]|nr:magnesium transporter [Pseudomonadota bacterium]
MRSNTEQSLRDLDSRSIANQLRGGSDEQIASALQSLPLGQAQKVLERLDPARREAIDLADVAHDLLLGRGYPDGTVGRLLESAPAVFAPDASVGQVIEVLREVVRQQLVVYVFVVDQGQVLRGVVAFRELVFAAPSQRLDEVMVREPFFLTARMPLVEAMHEVVTRHYPIYPVCEPDGRLLGLVRGAALFEQQAFEISAQAGAIVGVEKEERLATPWVRSFAFRHPWLLVNLLMAAFTVAVVSVFQDAINRVVLLALFMPVVSGQCGNLGSQSLAVVLRGMTLGELRPSRAYALVIKEGWLGFLNGLVAGVLAGAAMYVMASFRHESGLHLGGAVLAAMTASCTLAGMAGAAIPLLLRRFGADPATASGIFLSTVTDVVGMGSFLGLATLLM